MKVNMHSYLPNAPINLRLNFNFEKLVKRFRCAVLLRLGLKRVKIFRHVVKFSVQAYLSNGHRNL